jgi:hypothetical protein
MVKWTFNIMMFIAGKEGTMTWKKKILIGLGVGILLAGAAYWYIMSEKFEDTATTESAYTINAMELIDAFQSADSSANAKYSEQIITVNGRISEIEAADTTVNVKFINANSGSYLIFDFQSKDVAAAKVLQVGDSVALKGSCSGSIYSQLRNAHMISFKRSTLLKKFKPQKTIQ